MTPATCVELETRINTTDAPHQTLTSIGCSVVEFVEGSPEGCECRIVRNIARGGACPFDCAHTGAPACVTSPASSIGLHSLVSSGPLPLGPTMDEKSSQEATLCTYWAVRLTSRVGHADLYLASREAGRFRAEEIIQQATDNAKAYRAYGDMALMLSTTALPFNAGQAFQYPGGTVAPPEPSSAGAALTGPRPARAVLPPEPLVVPGGTVGPPPPLVPAAPTGPRPVQTGPPVPLVPAPPTGPRSVHAGPPPLPKAALTPI